MATTLEESGADFTLLPEIPLEAGAHGVRLEVRAGDDHPGARRERGATDGARRRPDRERDVVGGTGPRSQRQDDTGGPAAMTPTLSQPMGRHRVRGPPGGADLVGVDSAHVELHAGAHHP